jgi:lipoprotein-releasing system permease protein
MGASEQLIKRIFLKQGMMIAFSGALIGLILGYGVCLLQQTFGLVSLGISSAVVDAYPIKVVWTDFFWISISIIAITFAASWRPATIAAQVDTTAEL